jgi:uncharacterized membrane protein
MWVESGWVAALTVVAAVGCGLVGGVFLAFSGFVMPALRRLRDSDAAAAMQAINVTAVRPPLMAAMFGTAAACVGVGAVGLASLDETAGVLAVTGALVYLLGVVVLTGAYNVPRNNRLAGLEGGAAADYWPTYDRSWTRGNHVRTVAGVAAAVLLTVALPV